MTLIIPALKNPRKNFRRDNSTNDRFRRALIRHPRAVCLTGLTHLLLANCSDATRREGWSWAT